MVLHARSFAISVPVSSSVRVCSLSPSWTRMSSQEFMGKNLSLFPFLTPFPSSCILSHLLAHLLRATLATLVSPSLPLHLHFVSHLKHCPHPCTLALTLGQSRSPWQLHIHPCTHPRTHSLSRRSLLKH